MGLSSLLRDQLRLTQELYNDARFTVAFLVIWTASYGGALHAPVTTYFYVKLGASDTDIGYIGSIISIGALLSSVVMGWLLDRKGAYPVMFWSCFLCAIGCLVRGLAFNVRELFMGGAILGVGAGSLWTTGLVYLISNTPTEKQAKVVACYLAQVSALRIFGKMCYPAWHVLLVHGFGLQPGLLMDRISMGVCTLFCVYGSVLLLFYGKNISETERKRLLATKATMEVDVDSARTSLIDQPSKTDASSERKRSSALTLLCLGVGLYLQAVVLSGLSTIWPLLLRDWYGWSSQEFSVALLACSVLSTLGVAAVPKALKHLGGRTLTILLALCGCLCPWLALHAGTSFLSMATHIAATSLIIVTTTMLEPLIKGQAACLSSAGFQGKLFGSLAMVTGLGEASGSTLLTQLLDKSRHANGSHALVCISIVSGLIFMTLAPIMTNVDRKEPVEGMPVPRVFDSKTA